MFARACICSDDFAYSIACDASRGILYVGGATVSPLFLGQAGDTTTADPFLFALNASNSALLWVQRLACLNPWDGFLHDVVVDEITGRVYITGATKNYTFFDTPISSNGGDDIFIVCYSSAGTRIWHTLLGDPGSNHEQGYQLVLDVARGGGWVGGWSKSVGFYGQTNPASPGAASVVVVKFRLSDGLRLGVVFVAKPATFYALPNSYGYLALNERTGGGTVMVVIVRFLTVVVSLFGHTAGALVPVSACNCSVLLYVCCYACAVVQSSWRMR